jgi:DDE superfamily endonuclease
VVAANFGFNQTESGWMKGDAFFYFVTEHLNPRWNEMGIERPIVLVCDGYSGHHSFRLYDWSLKNDVVLVILYPNSTHLLQVLDVAVFAPLKQKYAELFQEWKNAEENSNKKFNEIVGQRKDHKTCRQNRRERQRTRNFVECA